MVVFAVIIVFIIVTVDVVVIIIIRGGGTLWIFEHVWTSHYGKWSGKSTGY